MTAQKNEQQENLSFYKCYWYKIIKMCDNNSLSSSGMIYLPEDFSA